MSSIILLTNQCTSLLVSEFLRKARCDSSFKLHSIKRQNLKAEWREGQRGGVVSMGEQEAIVNFNSLAEGT